MVRIVVLMLSLGGALAMASAGELHEAAHQGDLERMEALLAAGADIDARDDLGLTPLFVALDRGRTTAARFLIEKGADLRFRGFRQRTLLHMAARCGNLPIARLLVERGAEVNARDSRGVTPLRLAADAGKTEMIAYLIDQGASARTTDEHGTLLHRFVRQGNAPAVEALLAGGAEVDALDPHFGRTAIHQAAANGHEAIVRLLLEHGSSTSSRDSLGRTPLDLAHLHANQSVAELLRTHGAAGSPLAPPALASSLNPRDARLWHLGHCGWAIQTHRHVLIFDYWPPETRPAEPALANGMIVPAEIADHKVLVFVTHGHRDHYDPEILTWRDRIDDLTYVFGFRPIQAGDVEYIYVGPRERRMIGEVEVITIESNDAGVGFCVMADGLAIYHAGDHAGWRAREKDAYAREIEYLASEVGTVDLAFLNVTGCHTHCETALVEGTALTLEHLKPTAWFPTHAGGREYVYQQFARQVDLTASASIMQLPVDRGDCFECRDGRVMAPQP